MSTLSDEEMDRWYIFWDNMVPGTVFRIRDDLLVWMKPNDSHHTYDSLFSMKNGTIHHVTEYFCLADGIEHVQSYIAESIFEDTWPNGHLQ